MMRKYVLGLPVDVLKKTEVVDLLSKWIIKPADKLKQVVTAYSEFYVNGNRDLVFGKIIKKSDLVTPDGRSVLAAVAYKEISKIHKSVFLKFFDGLKVGARILKDDLGETVTGVWLLEEVCALAARKGWKVFVLGGWGNVNQRASKLLLDRFPNLRLMSDSGERHVGEYPEDNARVINKINKFKPDFLFVQYKPIQQEKWIYENRKLLKAKVAVGIGGTLDELVGDLKQAPIWMQKMGLKWLWRLIIQPKRWRRMVDAVIVFPWLVFREGIK